MSVSVSDNSSVTLNAAVCQPYCHCSMDFPKTPDYYRMMPWYIRVASTMCVCLYLVMLVLFILQLRAIHHYVSDPHRVTILSRIIAIFPVCGGCALMAILVPATTALMKLIIPCYLTETLHDFVALVHSFYGGRDQMVRASNNANVKLDPKVGMLKRCKCIPSFTVTARLLMLVSLVVYQAALTDLVLTMISFINWANGEAEIEEAYPAMRVVKLVATMAGNWACAVLADLTHEVIKQKYRLPQMFRVMQALLLTLNIQEAVFGLLVSVNIFPDYENLSDEIVGSVYNFILLIFEMCALAAVCTWYFRPANCALFDKFPANVARNGGVVSVVKHHRQNHQDELNDNQTNKQTDNLDSSVEISLDDKF